MSERHIDFAGQTVIVTGAGSGLGRTYAIEIARRGGHVVVNDLGSSVAGQGGSIASAEAVVDEIRQNGERPSPAVKTSLRRKGHGAWPNRRWTGSGGSTR